MVLFFNEVIIRVFFYLERVDIFVSDGKGYYREKGFEEIRRGIRVVFYRCVFIGIGVGRYIVFFFYCFILKKVVFFM